MNRWSVPQESKTRSGNAMPELLLLPFFLSRKESVVYLPVTFIFFLCLPNYFRRTMLARVDPFHLSRPLFFWHGNRKFLKIKLLYSERCRHIGNLKNLSKKEVSSRRKSCHCSYSIFQFDSHVLNAITTEENTYWFCELCPFVVRGNFLYQAVYMCLLTQ